MAEMWCLLSRIVHIRGSSWGTICLFLWVTWTGTFRRLSYPEESLKCWRSEKLCCTGSTVARIEWLVIRYNGKHLYEIDIILTPLHQNECPRANTSWDTVEATLFSTLLLWIVDNCYSWWSIFYLNKQKQWDVFKQMNVVVFNPIQMENFSFQFKMFLHHL